MGAINFCHLIYYFALCATYCYRPSMAVDSEIKFEGARVVDGGWGWIVVFGSLMIHVISGGIVYCFGLFVQPLVEYFDVGRADIGWIASLMIGVTWGSVLCAVYFYRPSMANDGEIKFEGARVVDGGWGWIVVFGSLMIHVIADGVTYSFGLFVQPLVEYFDVGRADIGWIASLMIGVTWGSGPIASLLTNRYGCRLISIVGTLIAVVGLCLTILAPTNGIWVMYVCFGVIAGFGLGLVYLPAIVAVSYYFVKRRSFAIGLAVCGSGLGTFIIAPVIQYLLDEYGWKGTMLIETGLVMNCFVCGALFRGVGTGEPHAGSAPVHSGQKINETPDIVTRFISPVHSGYLFPNARIVDNPSCEFQSVTKVCSSQPSSQTIVKLSSSRSNSLTNAYPEAMPENGKEEQADEELGLEPKESQLDLPTSLCSGNVQPSPPDKDSSAFLPLKHHAFIMFAVSNFLTSIGYCVPYIFLPDRAVLLGIEDGKPAFLISAIGISNTLARVVFGYVADFECVNRLLVYCTVLVLCGLATILSHFCTVFYMLVIYSLLFGLFIGIYTCLIPVVLVDLFGLDNLSKSFGLVLLSCGVGAVLGPPMAGWIFDVTQDYTFSFIAMGAAVALSGVMLYPVICVKKPQQVRPQKSQ